MNQRMPEQVNAWLHIAEDGSITVYTGKVEVGQNARTSLTQAAAEELHAPVASIRLVMGDTALTPFDMGTFGSMTTPQHVATNPQGFRGRPRDAHRPGIAKMDGRPRRHRRCRWQSHAPAALRRFRRPHPRRKTHSAPFPPASRSRLPRVESCRQLGPKGERPRNRHRRAPLCLRYPASRHAVRQGALSAFVRRQTGSRSIPRSRGHTRRARSCAARSPASARPAATWWACSPPIRHRRKSSGRTQGGMDPADRPAFFQGRLRLLQANRRRRRFAAPGPGVLHRCLHRPRSAGTARRAGRMVRGWQADGLDRLAASLRRTQRTGAAEFGIPEDSVRVIVPDTGSGYGGKHQRRCRGGSGRPGQGRRQTSEAQLDPRRGNDLGLLPPRRSDRSGRQS